MRAEFMDIGISANAAATIDNLSIFMEATMCVNPGCHLQVICCQIQQKAK
jgi:hypothetical protein